MERDVYYVSAEICARTSISSADTLKVLGNRRRCYPYRLNRNRGTRPLVWEYILGELVRQSETFSLHAQMAKVRTCSALP